MGKAMQTRHEMDDTLHIAEIPWDSGTIRFRYSRILSEDGLRWVRHGLFVAYHESGAIASEGHYQHGAEEGTWCDYHENGCLAAEGYYRGGKEEGVWRFWAADGTGEKAVKYIDGHEVKDARS
jgi:antitoxin component YwqK of YwqJK toxin-antitoxin module